jgi:hypothetical protein
MQAQADRSSMCDVDALKLGVRCRCAEAPDLPASRVEGWGVPGWAQSHAANCARAQEAKDVDVLWFGDSITGASSVVDPCQAREERNGARQAAAASQRELADTREIPEVQAFCG